MLLAPSDLRLIVVGADQSKPSNACTVKVLRLRLTDDAAICHDPSAAAAMVNCVASAWAAVCSRGGARPGPGVASVTRYCGIGSLSESLTLNSDDSSTLVLIAAVVVP